MQVAVRSYLTSGVALVGAGAIALAPMTPLPDLSVREAGTATATVYANYTPTALASAFVDEDPAQIAHIASALVGSPIAAAATLALPTPSEVALALGQLIAGKSQAFNIGVGGITNGINAGLTGLQNITTIAGTSLQGINNALTTAVLAALGLPNPPPLPPAAAAALAARALSALALPTPSEVALARRPAHRR